MYGRTNQDLEKSKELIGKRFSTKSYGDFTVLEETDKRKNKEVIYKILFETGNYGFYGRKAILQGAIKNTYFPSVAGVGFTGDIVEPSKHFLYYRWKSMLQRCYQVNYFCYHNYGGKGFIVQESWKNFENFIEDVKTLKGYDEELVKNGILELDKDIINREAKLYGIETCSWVSFKENTQERTDRFSKEISATNVCSNLKFQYKNLTEAGRALNLNSTSISAVLRGKFKTLKGWTFEYI